MVSVRHVFISVCFLALAFATQPAPAKGGLAEQDAPVLQVPLHLVVAAVTGWVAAELGEPVPDALPAIVFMDRASMRAIRGSGGAPSRESESEAGVQALYLDDSRTVVLPAGWTGATAAQVSMLVHEVVHHFQALRGDIHACPAAREKLAYEVQERWLRAHGESLESALGIDRFYLLIATNCLF
jgi:hypothetical protein